METLTGKGSISDTLIWPTAANVRMVSRKPNLSKVRCVMFLRSPFPEGWTERSPGLIQSKGMKAMLNFVREVGVIELVRGYC